MWKTLPTPLKWSNSFWLDDWCFTTNITYAKIKEQQFDLIHNLTLPEFISFNMMNIKSIYMVNTIHLYIPYNSWILSITKFSFYILTGFSLWNSPPSYMSSSESSPASTDALHRIRYMQQLQGAPTISGNLGPNEDNTFECKRKFPKKSWKIDH